MFTTGKIMGAGGAGDIPTVATTTLTGTLSRTSTYPTSQSVNIGSASVDRYVVVCVEAFTSLTGPTINSISINGTSCMVANAHEDRSYAANTAIAVLKVTTGTTALITVTGSGGVTANTTHVFSVVGNIESATPVAIATGGSLDDGIFYPITLDLNWSGRDAVVISNISAYSSSGLSGPSGYVITQDVNSGYRFYTAHQSGAVSGSSATLQWTPASNFGLGSCACAIALK